MNREHYAFAVSDFTRALELDASHTQALYDRGLLYWRELSDSRQAERDLTRVLREEPERTEAWFTRGMVRVTLDNTTGAIADFERYLEEGEDAMWREISERQVALLRTPGAGGEEME